MIVSKRHIVFAGAVGLCALASPASVSMAEPSGGSYHPPPTHTVRTPHVNVGGTGVSIHTSHVTSHTSHSTHVSTQVHTRNVSERPVFIFGGGGSYCCDAGPGPSAIENLNVVGEEIEVVTEEVEVQTEEMETRTRMVEERIAVRAVCIDDNGTPHPASRPSPDENVPAGFSGEIFRCIAGTTMQATLGSYDGGAANFDQGTTMTCSREEALRYAPGGSLTCAPQEARRDCNERSLLRRYGPGDKILTVMREEAYEVAVPRTRYETVSREIVHTIDHEAGAIVLDGGVGGTCGGC